MINKAHLAAAIALSSTLVSAQITIVDSMGVTHDSGQESNPSPSWTTGYTPAETGNDNLLVLMYGGRARTDNEMFLQSATFGGVAMTMAGDEYFVDSGSNASMVGAGIFYIPEADFASISGSELVINFGNTAKGARRSMFSLLTLSGVNQSAPIGVSGTLSGDPTIPANTALELNSLTTGSLILSALSGAAGSDSQIAAGSNIDTVIGTYDAFDNVGFGATEVNGSTESFSWIYSGTGSMGALVAAEFTAVPEPSTYVLLGGLAALALATSRRISRRK